MMPGEYDTGARAAATLFHSHLHVTYALVNGVMEGESSFTVVPDLNKGKDSVGRINWDFGPADIGVSGYAGQGQVVDPSARCASRTSAATPSTWRPAITRSSRARSAGRGVYGEVVLGTNMDRGVMYGATRAPDHPHTDRRRRDQPPRAEHLDPRRAGLSPAGPRSACGTTSTRPIAPSRTTGATPTASSAWSHFTRGLQLMAEYDHAIDNVHAAGAGAPSRHISTPGPACCRRASDSTSRTLARSATPTMTPPSWVSAVSTSGADGVAVEIGGHRRSERLETVDRGEDLAADLQARRGRRDRRGPGPSLRRSTWPRRPRPPAAQDHRGRS